MVPDTGSAQRSTDGLTGGVAAIVGVAMLIATSHLPYVDRNGPGAALAPAIVGIALVACGIALMTSARGIALGGLQPDRRDARIVAALAGLLAAAFAIDRIGFAPTIALLVAWSARVVVGATLRQALALAVLAALGGLAGSIR